MIIQSNVLLTWIVGKTFSHLQTNDGKQGDNGHPHSVNEANNTKEVPEEYKMLLYMVSYCGRFKSVRCHSYLQSDMACSNFSHTANIKAHHSHEPMN